MEVLACTYWFSPLDANSFSWVSAVHSDPAVSIDFTVCYSECVHIYVCVHLLKCITQQSNQHWRQRKICHKLIVIIPNKLILDFASSTFFIIIIYFWQRCFTCLWIQSSACARNYHYKYKYKSLIFEFLLNQRTEKKITSLLFLFSSFLRKMIHNRAVKEITHHCLRRSDG